MRWYIEYQIAGRRAQYRELSGLTKAVCGTTPAAHVRIPSKVAGVGALLELEAKTDGLLLRCLEGTQLELEYGGRKHRVVSVPWEQDVFLGQVRLCFLGNEAAGVRDPLPLGLLFLALVAIACLLGWKGKESLLVGYSSESESPQLFSSSSIACQKPIGVSVLQRADSLRASGEGKLARYPFEPSVVHSAVNELSEAAQCLVDAQEIDRERAEDIRKLREESSLIRTQAERDYAALRLALNNGRRNEDASAIAEAATRIASLLALPKGHPYARFLSMIERNARDTLRASAEGEERP